MEDTEVLTQEYLKKILHYNELTGIFTWKERPVSMFKTGIRQLNACGIWNSRFANKEAGAILTPKESKTYYVSITIALNGKKKNYLAHRLAFLYTEGHFPPEDVDHIDGNGLNNCWINLREVTALKNMKNMPMRSDNTSGVVGVHWHKLTKKWQAQINVNRKQIHGGLFTNIEDAIARREQLELEHGYHKNHGRKTKP